MRNRLVSRSLSTYLRCFPISFIVYNY